MTYEELARDYSEVLEPGRYELLLSDNDDCMLVKVEGEAVGLITVERDGDEDVATIRFTEDCDPGHAADLAVALDRVVVTNIDFTPFVATFITNSTEDSVH